MQLAQFLETLDRPGRRFEDAVAWFLLNDPVYRQQVKRVWLWQDWPGCWGRDCGIDLVAETIDGELWAIQAKNYSEQTTVTKADVDTFLSESARPTFSYRLLVASTDRISRNAHQAIEGQEKPVGLLLRSQLESSPLDWSLAIRRAKAKPTPRPLRDHQQEALTAVLAGFRRENRGQLVMACGTGKTRVGLAVAERLRSQRTLVLVPSLLLLAQTAREWALDAEHPFRSLFVCSDESVADKARAGYDEPISNVADLGLPVTTDPGAIASFLAGDGRRVVFSTYQSSPMVAAASRHERVTAQLTESGDPFDLIVADEAHRCAGPASGVFATALNDELLPARRHLFMTATPRVYTSRVRDAAEEQEMEIASMDDPELFGPVLHRLSFAEAIDRDLLSDYRVLVVGVTDEEAHQLVESGAFVTPDGERVTDARSLARAIGLLKAIRDYDLRRLISFHGRINRAREFASLLEAVTGALPASSLPTGLLETAYISGEMTAGARRRLLRRLRELPGVKRMLVANARCLTEGIDVPALDGVAFIDPRSSQIDIVQAVGRAIRLADDKTLGTIIIPVLIGEDDDPVDVLEGSEFQPVWQIVNALRSHDDSLGEEIDAMCRGLGRTGTADQRPGKLVLGLPRRIDFERFSDAFDARLVARTGSSFALALSALDDFVQSHGHARVLPSYVTEDGLMLGVWCERWRQNRRRGKLAAERIVALDALGFVWHPREDDWQQGLTALKEFVDQHGHARVPQRHITTSGFRLGLWCANRRARRGDLTAERIAALDALGFVWDPLEDDWNQGFAALKEFVDRHGHAHVVMGYTTDTGFGLGGWCNKQRQNRKRGKVAAERIAALDALGFVWDQLADKWQQGVAALEEFVDQHGHGRVPPAYMTTSGFQLGYWCANRRAARRRGKLTVERIAALDALGFVWDPREYDRQQRLAAPQDSVGSHDPARVPHTAWQQGVVALKEFVDQHGHARVPNTYVAETGVKLGTWCKERRQDRKRGKLSLERMTELDELGFEWDPQEANWQRGLAALKRFVDHNGHARVPDTYVAETGVKLGAWCGERRTARKRGTLPAERIAALDALGFVWQPREADWQRGLAALTEFVDQHGHARVPVDYEAETGFKLGAWCGERRTARRRGTLAADRIAALDALGFAWDPREDDWQQGLAALTEFVDQHGHARVPTGFVTETGLRLGAWCDTRRQKARSGKLAAERVADLDALGFVWNPREDDWQQGLAALKEFVNRHGHARVPQPHETETGFQLGAWCSSRRQQRRRAELVTERIEALDKLGFVWEPRHDDWQRALAAAEQFVRRHGHARVPFGYETETGFKLGRWCGHRRAERRRGKLAAERIAALDALGFVWDPRPQPARRT